jgi:hypothetical protein
MSSFLTAPLSRDQTASAKCIRATQFIPRSSHPKSWQRRRLGKNPNNVFGHTPRCTPSATRCEQHDDSEFDLYSFSRQTARRAHCHTLNRMWNSRNMHPSYGTHRQSMLLISFTSISLTNKSHDVTVHPITPPPSFFQPGIPPRTTTATATATTFVPCPLYLQLRTHPQVPPQHASGRWIRIQKSTRRRHGRKRDRNVPSRPLAQRHGPLHSAVQHDFEEDGDEDNYE